MKSTKSCKFFWKRKRRESLFGAWEKIFTFQRIWAITGLNNRGERIWAIWIIMVKDMANNFGHGQRHVEQSRGAIGETLSVNLMRWNRPETQMSLIIQGKGRSNSLLRTGSMHIRVYAWRIRTGKAMRLSGSRSEFKRERFSISDSVGTNLRFSGSQYMKGIQ